MTAFPEWLGQMGLAHCRPILLAHGIDFDSAAHLSEERPVPPRTRPGR